MAHDKSGSGRNVNRRKILKAAATGATMITATGAGQAKRIGRGQNGAKDKGLTTAVRQQLKDGKTDQAIKLLEKHDVKYDSFQTQTVQGTGGGNSGIGTQSVFDNDPSDFTFLAYQLAGPLYSAELTWDLSPHASADCLQPNDVAAVTYDGSRWQIEGNEWYDYHTEDFYSESSGFFGLWDDEVAYVMSGDTTGHIGATLQKADPYRGGDQKHLGSLRTHLDTTLEIELCRRPIPGRGRKSISRSVVGQYLGRLVENEERPVVSLIHNPVFEGTIVLILFPVSVY